MDNVYILNEISQGRLKEDKETCFVFRCIYRKHMILCGGMVCGYNCGTWV